MGTFSKDECDTRQQRSGSNSEVTHLAEPLLQYSTSRLTSKSDVIGYDVFSVLRQGRYIILLIFMHIWILFALFPQDAWN